MTSQIVLILLLGVLIILAGAAVFWGITRRYRRELGMQSEVRDKTSETSFIINAFQDVTKQLKEKEKELERLKAIAEQRAETIESYHENILQCVTSGVMTFDAACRLTTFNRSAEELLGLKQGSADRVDCVTLFGDNEITRAVHTTLDTGTPSARMEAMITRQDGRIWLGFNTAILADRKGSALGVILSFSDLTEVKRLQEQVELRERLSALGEMSAGIAHELRNPMAVMSGYLSLLSKKASSEHQKIIQSITSEITGMNRIIGELLAFARPASLNRVKVSLKEMVEGCVVQALQAAGAGKTVKTEISLVDGDIAADEMLIRQAVTNLFQNAIEAMSEEGTLTVSLRRSAEDVILEVKDTGQGIAPGNIKKIFMPFFTTKDNGIGMGLALTHKIVTSHGGRIEVESEPGRGTTFRVSLPRGNCS